jgi:hypothetical protein
MKGKKEEEEEEEVSSKRKKEGGGGGTQGLTSKAAAPDVHCTECK